jgi:two-component system OmpR family response regulator
MSKGKILVVDDEQQIVECVSARLRSFGYEVITAMHGSLATALALEEKPDLIILDINMPEMDGHAVVRALRNSLETGYIPIIFLSARTTEEDYQEAIRNGIERYITKPFTSEELIVAVEELVCTAVGSRAW